MERELDQVSNQSRLACRLCLLLTLSTTCLSSQVLEFQNSESAGAAASRRRFLRRGDGSRDRAAARDSVSGGSGVGGGEVARQALSEEGDETCPICQDEMTAAQCLTWCRRSCGNNAHAKCMMQYCQFKIANKQVLRVLLVEPSTNL
jgi:hypothetical protein